MAAGSIIIDLLMKTGSFETDTDRAAKKLKGFQKDVIATASSIKTQLVGALAGVGVALSFDALIDGAAKFKDLEEETGATAQDLASLATAAGVAGVEVSSIAAAANKLTKSLSGVDDESKAAGAALASLGIPIEEFKRLDPVARVDALTKAFNSFADGPEKSAVALALFGKAGAEQLKVFKALGEEGGRQVILTQAQIELADAYSDRQAKLTATIKQYAQAGATDLLPTLNDLTTVSKQFLAEIVGIDSSGKKLAGESPIAQFADGAATAFAYLIDIGQGVAGLFQSIGISIGAAAASGAAILEGEFGQAKTIAAEAAADIAKVLNPELFSQRLAKLRAASAAAALGDPNQSSAETARLGRKPRIEFDGALAKPKGQKATQSEAEKYLETLQKQNESLVKQTSYEKALAEINAKRLTGITPKLKAQILEQAKLNDLKKIELELRDAETARISMIAKAQLDNIDALQKGNKELTDEIALIGADELAQVAVERARVSSTRALKEEELARKAAAGAADETLQALEAEIAALKEREDLLGKKIGKTLEQRTIEANAKSAEKTSTAFADSIEQGILTGFRRGESLSDVFLNELKAQFAKTVLRPLIEPISAGGNDLIGQLIGAAVSAFSGSTGVGITSGDSALSATGDAIRARRAGGGDANPNPYGAILVGEKGPELFNPSTSGRIIPNNALGGGREPKVTIENYGARVEQRKTGNGDLRLIIDAVKTEVNRDIASGAGGTARAIRSRGVNLDRVLARRG